MLIQSKILPTFMNEPVQVQTFEIPALQIKYSLKKLENKIAMVELSENDFEKVFQKIRELQTQIAEVQDQLIEALKREALIKNILG